MCFQNELLLDSVKLLCSTQILKHVTLQNVCSLATLAAQYICPELSNSLFDYMAKNLETLLENRYLTDLSLDVLNPFTIFIRERQETLMPITRSDILVIDARIRYQAWLDEQDYPSPLLSTATSLRKIKSPLLQPVDRKKSPALQPIDSRRRHNTKSPKIAHGSLIVDPLVSALTPVDDIFLMDDEERSVHTPTKRLLTPTSSASSTPQALTAQPESSTRSASKPWRSPTVKSLVTE